MGRECFKFLNVLIFKAFLVTIFKNKKLINKMKKRNTFPRYMCLDGFGKIVGDFCQKIF